MLKFVRNIPWRIIGYICMSVVGLFGIGMLMSLVKTKDSVQVCTSMKVMVEGKETFIDQHDISDLVNGEFGRVVGKELATLPLEKIEKALMTLPYVASAEIHSDMDGVLQIAVKQREVIIRIMNNMGQEYYIDTQGAKVPVTLKYVPHVLVANGNINEGYKVALDTVETQLVKDLVSIVNFVKNDPLWSNQIVQLYVNEHKDIEITPRVGTQQLLLGNADNLPDKLDRLSIFYKKILPRVGSDAYSTVNVKFDDQIICEREDGWVLDSLQMKLKMK
ncbi:cell division protein FtsQ [Sphingobacterium shayense]|uniref:cell division protein FtsQ/DivIB n=1 Tax=Sphingobacterium shayense TaxID=626343 RepID=UPI0015544FC4|nr:cell division protein FtsQ [Sphingobacterium shayense]NQD71063.1 cell division protein FtsQ [Sphingobacterium shayense]